MKIRFGGVRGSTPVAGEKFARVGGHTSCLAISAGDELPTLLLDAGTGIQTLSAAFDGVPFTGTILLTHLHWDHMQGIPFFPPADNDKACVVVGQPAQGDPYEVLARQMSPPSFPIMPDGLRGKWRFIGVEAGKHQFGVFTVLARDVVHKGGRAFGYRVTHDGASFAYVPDALDANDEAILELAADADLLIRGAPFVAAERERADLFGHGTVEHAVDIAQRANVGRLIITHHSPVRSDAEVEAIAAEHGITPATEGMTVEV
jgi:phosphoribosyl 1,2-cyclic phosphodiesterase